jgi:predicted metal-dependent enzyme (double-stranded beta helix superfamily)
MSHRVSRRVFLAGTAGLVAAGAASARGASDERQRVATSKFDVERFIDDVKRARKDPNSQAAVQEVLARAVAEPGAVLAGLGEPTDVGIHTLYRADDLTILNVVWAPLMVLLPHNHNMWASIGIYTGREDNIVWDRSGPVIEASDAASLSEKEVFALDDTAIHSVTNPIRRLTGAIHVYGGDFFAAPRSEWDAESLRERPFDLEAARRLFIEANERFKATR